MRKQGLDICKEVCFNRGKIAALKKRLPPVQDLELKAARLKAIGHPGRLAVLLTLTLEDCCVCDLSHTLNQPVSTVSQHLRILKSVGFVRCRHAGKFVVYSATATVSILSLRKWLGLGSAKKEKT